MCTWLHKTTYFERTKAHVRSTSLHECAHDYTRPHGAMKKKKSPTSEVFHCTNAHSHELHKTTWGNEKTKVCIRGVTEPVMGYPKQPRVALQQTCHVMNKTDVLYIRSSKASSSLLTSNDLSWSYLRHHFNHIEWDIPQARTLLAAILIRILFEGS